MLLEESEEQTETHVGLADNKALLQTLDGTVLFPVVDVDVEGAGSQRDSCKILDLRCLSGREEHGLSLVLGQNLDDLAHFVFEADFENTIGFIDDQGLDILVDKALGVLQVIKQTSGGSDEQVDTLDQLLGLGAAVGSSNDDTEGLRVVGHEFAGDTKNLKGEFAGGRNDNDTGT